MAGLLSLATLEALGHVPGGSLGIGTGFGSVSGVPRSGLRGPIRPLGGGGLPTPLAKELLQVAVSDIKSRFMTGTAPDGTKWRPLSFKRARGGDQPLRDTGQLMASISGEIGAGGELIVSTNRVGARLQHFGGKIVPKLAKVLTIPLTKEAARSGGPRRHNRRPDDPIPFFARLIGGQMVGHWLCVKKVTVPARPFMEISKAALAIISDRLLEYSLQVISQELS